MSMAQNYLKSMSPRNLEILERIVLGQSQKEISVAMNITPVRVNIIVNSPLFKLELKKALIKKYEHLATMEANLLEASESGSKLLKEVVDDVARPIDTRIKAALASQMMTLKMIQMEKHLSPSNDKDGDGDEPSYEEHLKKVTYEESVRTVTPGQQSHSNSDPDLDKEVEGLLLDNTQLSAELDSENKDFEKGENLL